MAVETFLEFYKPILIVTIIMKNYRQVYILFAIFIFFIYATNIMFYRDNSSLTKNFLNKRAFLLFYS